MDQSLCTSLIKWLQTFSGHKNISPEGLSDGVALGNILHIIAPEYFDEAWLTKIKSDVGDNWRLKLSNLHKIHQGVVEFYTDNVTNLQQSVPPDLKKISEHADEKELGNLLQLVLGCAINCKNKQKHIEAIMKMEADVQEVIALAINDLTSREGSTASAESNAPFMPSEEGLPSFHPHMKSLIEQLESTSLAKEEMNRRCNEMDHQLSILSEERNHLKSENEKLLERVEVLEKGGDFGSTRYSDLRKQVEGLQDELYKTESAKEEYKIRVEELEKVVSEVMTKNEELQVFADEAKSLKDEVDALREVSDKVVEYETTIETFKRRLEELSDLRRQVKILEEKNSNYMQNNIEMEEEIKKTGTLRPQVEIIRKQMADLHQKMAEETKQKDKLAFENKKLSEKLEAATQERDRIVLERFELQKNLEELKCSSTADSTSRSPSDLSDLDALEIVSPEIREKLMRLQHENRLLKKKVNEKGDESAPVLESMFNDLQERFDSLQQENRWSKNWSSSLRTSSLYDGHLLPRKLQLLKRNLKWASESDLLVLRKPSSILSNFLTHPSSTLPPKSLPISLTQRHNNQPIVIRHIHEFKMASSPTNEDSGCCRTSPSSCEGSDDSHIMPYRDYGNTLDSGVSSICRCISPTIPSIVEECTTYHLSDISPALHEANQSVMTHSHPAHTVCHRCCSPKPTCQSTEPLFKSDRLCESSSAPTPPPCKEDVSIQSESPLKSSFQISPFSVSTAPASPTPHNSPKLPHSVHFHRSKGHRNSISSKNSTQSINGSDDTANTKNVSKRSKSVDKSRSKHEQKHRINWSLDDARAVNNRFKDSYPSKMRERVAALSTDHTSSGCESSCGPRGSKHYFERNREWSDAKSFPSNANSEFIRNNPFGSSIRRKEPFRRHSIDTSSSPKKFNHQSLYKSESTNIIEEKVHPIVNSAKNETLEKSDKHLSSRAKKVEFDSPLVSHKDNLSKSNNDVKILTDSLFTHFMVSPPHMKPLKTQAKLQKSSSKPFSKTKPKSEFEDMSSSISDICGELLELKLATCAFGAPIVSSESFTSVAQSDATDAPLATEYFSDHESEMGFNPHQYKLVDSRDPYSINRKPKHTFAKTEVAKSSVDTKISSDKNLKKPVPPVGIAKPKKKTTRNMMSDAVNAVFSFYTP